MAFDSLAAGKTGIREELPVAPSFPGLIPSPLPHLSMPKKTGRGAEACVSEGRVPGNKSKWGYGSGFVVFFFYFSKDNRI